MAGHMINGKWIQLGLEKPLVSGLIKLLSHVSHISNTIKKTSFPSTKLGIYANFDELEYAPNLIAISTKKVG